MARPADGRGRRGGGILARSGPGGPITDPYLADAVLQLHKLKGLADRAVAQTRDADFFRTLDPESNSIALIMKHVSGNMRSRWTAFLTSDGEKPDRNRDSEFVVEPGDTKATILGRWETGWRLLFEAITPLTTADLGRVTTLRGEPHTVLEAINRQLAHYASHVGQIVLLAKHFAGPAWQTLSVPRGQSKELEVSKDGTTYRPVDP